MICPNCNSEYRDGFTRCSDCDLPLVEPLPAEADADVELVRIFVGTNPAVLPFVESLLNEAGIEYMKKFDAVQRVLGAPQIVAPVEFWVRSDDEGEAVELLGGIDESGRAGFLLPSAP